MYKKRDKSLEDLKYLYDPKLENPLEGRELIYWLLDSQINEFKPNYGDSMLTITGKLMG